MTKNHKLILSIIIALFLGFRLIGLGGDITNTDAYRWHKRSDSFLAGVKSLDFKETYQHYQPGVTLMWVNSFVKQAIFSYRYHIVGDQNPPTLENVDWFPQIHGFSKAALVATLLVLLLVQMSYVKELFNNKTALIFGFIMALEPYLIGIDRWFHLTSLEGYFALLSILALLLWKKSPNTKKHLMLSAAFFALAALSKITAVLLGPLILWLLLQERSLKSIAIYGISFITTILILFPAVLVSPAYVYAKFYTAIFEAVSGVAHVEVVNPWIRLVYYDVILFLKTAPITLVVLIASIKNLQTNFKNINYKALLFGFLSYYVVLTLSKKKIDRYVIAMFPIMLLMASVYLGQINLKNLKIVIGLHFGFLVLITYLFFPVFSSYYSPVFGGTKTAVNLGVYDNSGEYFADAARFLNTKGREVLVFIPNGNSSFSYFHKGVFTAVYTPEADYVVSSLDQDRPTAENYECENLEAEFGSKEYPVVFVYSCN